MNKFYTKQEKEDFQNWHEESYQEDLEVAELILPHSSRWLITSGYYSMHNITKLYLALKNIFITDKEHVHESVINKFEECCHNSEKDLRELLKTLKFAESIYEKEFQDPRKIHYVLRSARSERSNSTYYSKIESMDAKVFMRDIVKPYIKALEAMIEDVRKSISK